LAIDPASQIRQILAACSEPQREEIIKLLRAEYRTHRIERDWNTSAEIVLEAIARSGPLTQRMFKGILAEAAFKVEVLDKLNGWQEITPPGTHAYDFAVRGGDQTVTIQTKLQRKQGGKPFMYRIPGKRGPDSAFFVVETQKSRKGTDRTSGQSTRPYRFGEFDLLAVSMEPATGDWSQFRFTVGRWLIPRLEDPALIAIYQPVSLEPNEDWTDSLVTAIQWLRSGGQKTISIERAAEGSGG
jgi:DNA-binding transcriptional ArsR family regulator